MTHKSKTWLSTPISGAGRFCTKVWTDRIRKYFFNFRKLGNQALKRIRIKAPVQALVGCSQSFVWWPNLKSKCNKCIKRGRRLVLAAASFDFLLPTTAQYSVSTAQPVDWTTTLLTMKKLVLCVFFIMLGVTTGKRCKGRLRAGGGCRARCNSITGKWEKSTCRQL